MHTLPKTKTKYIDKDGKRIKCATPRCKNKATVNYKCKRCYKAGQYYSDFSRDPLGIKYAWYNIAYNLGQKEIDDTPLPEITVTRGRKIPKHNNMYNS